MRSVILSSIVLLMLFLCGCEWAMIDKNDFIAVNDNVKLVSNQLDIVQDAMTKTAENGLLNAKTVENINEKIEEYQPTLVKAADAIANAPTLIEGVIEANKLSAPVNPYAGTIDLVLKLIAGLTVPTVAVGGIKIAKDAKEKKDLKIENVIVKRKYSANKKGLDDLRMKHPEEFKENYELVGNVRAVLGV